MKTLLFISIYVLTLTSSLAQDSSLAGRCGKPGFSCGECETGLQDDFNGLLNKITGNQMGSSEHWGDAKDKKDVSNIPLKEQNVDTVLKDIISMFKKHNPSGANKLNYLVIGESESLQASSMKDGKMNPRVLLKSPNSELMVTFNTDPKAKGYKTIEVMRWNGKQGRYEFQEINFGEAGEPPHVDASGKKCLECHKSPSPRPNWDTYRAWAGIVPSRDDMLEAKVGSDGKLKPANGLQPDARAYLGFLDRIAAEKDGKAPQTRLALLDIPFDDKVQLAKYVKNSKTALTNKEKVELIKRNINETGFYRVKHYPDKDEAEGDEKFGFNFDEKTARYAGPSQFAFDQMLSQNMCKVATDLKKNKNFDKFKYPLAHMIKCEGVDTGSFYPEEFKKKTLEHFKTNKYDTLNDLPVASKPTQSTPMTYDKLKGLIRQDTDKNHGSTNLYKFNKHEKFLTGYLSQVEKLPAAKVKTDAKYYSEKVSTPYQDDFHAINDPSGVKGVAEASTDRIANIRVLLEPFGVDVAHWSLVHGKNNAYNSYSFSDQFVQFEQQKLFDEILEEAGSCAELEKRIPAGLLLKDEEKKTTKAPSSDIIESIEGMCATFAAEDNLPLPMDKIKNMLSPVVALAKPKMQKMLSKCLTCHDGQTEFSGMQEFVKSNPSDASPASYIKLSEYLNKFTLDSKMPNVQMFQYKLGVHEMNPYGMDMPPGDWDDNQEYAQENGIDPINVQNIRRKELALWLTMAASQDNANPMKALCNQLNADNKLKEVSGPDSGSRSNTKAKQE